MPAGYAAGAQRACAILTRQNRRLSSHSRPMSAVIEVVLPVFGIILAGFLCGWRRLLGEDSSRALNGFVFYVALPALFFLAMARLELDDPSLVPFTLTLTGAMVIPFAFIVVLARQFLGYRLGEVSMHGLAGVFANTGYMGIPLLLTAYGEPGVLPGVVATVFNGAVVIGLGTAVMEIHRSEKSGFLPLFKTAGGGLARNPLVLSAVAGLVVGQLKIPLPAALVTFCEILGGAVGPCALFAMGLFLVGRSVTRGALEVAWLTIVKLLISPLIAWVLAFHVFDMDPLWAASSVILSALPLGALVFILAQQYEIYVQRATAVILVSTLCSVVTLSIVMNYLGVD